MKLKNFQMPRSVQIDEDSILYKKRLRELKGG